MSGQDLLEKRAALLSKAIQACEAFNVVLDEVRSTSSTSLSENTRTIRDEVRRLEEELSARMRASAERRNEIVPPFTCLTVDVVRKIFEMAIEDLPMHHFPGVFGTPAWRVPINISHVCRRWRAIALDSPKLWTLVALFRPPVTPAASERWHPAFHAADTTPGDLLPSRHLVFIQRAKSVPIRTAFSMDHPRNLIANERLLALCNNRVAKLDLYLTGTGASPLKMLSYVSLVSWHLREISFNSFRNHDAYSVPEWEQAMQSFFSMELPASRQLRLYGGTPLPLKFVNGIKALESCRVLILNTLPLVFQVATANTILSLLGAAPHLVEFGLEGGQGLWATPEESGPVWPVIRADNVVMKCLESFRFVRDELYSVILPFIEAPSLRRLSLYMSISNGLNKTLITGRAVFDHPQSLIAVTDFVRSSTSSLETLDLRNAQPDLLRRVLEVALAITTLAIIPHSTIDIQPYIPILGALACPPTIETASLCPNLERLIVNALPLPACLDALADFARQRRSSSSLTSIRRLEVPFHKDGQFETAVSSLPHPLEACCEAEEALAEVVDEFVMGPYMFDIPTKAWRKRPAGSITSLAMTFSV